jgi:hypothetical protein
MEFAGKDWDNGLAPASIPSFGDGESKPVLV